MEDPKLLFDVDNYHNTFNKYPKCLMESGGKIYGWWYFGNYYKRVKGYHGEYPRSYMARMRALFPGKEPVLHVFGGTVSTEETDEIKTDINPDLNPDVCCNAQDLPFKEGTYELVYSDPPYTKVDANKYGYKMPNMRLVLRSIRRVVKHSSGILVWMDTKIPIFRKYDWQLLGTIGLFTGTNRAIRVCAIFKASTEEEYMKGVDADKDQKIIKQTKKVRD